MLVEPFIEKESSVPWEKQRLGLRRRPLVLKGLTIAVDHYYVPQNRLFFPAVHYLHMDHTRCISNDNLFTLKQLSATNQLPQSIIVFAHSLKSCSIMRNTLNRENNLSYCVVQNFRIQCILCILLKQASPLRSMTARLNSP